MKICPSVQQHSQITGKQKASSLQATEALKTSFSSTHNSCTVTSANQTRHSPLYQQQCQYFTKTILEQSADSLKAFCKSQLDLSLMSSQCCVHLEQAKKKEQRLISKIRFTLETPALPMRSQAMGKIQNHWPKEQHT